VPMPVAPAKDTNIPALIVKWSAYNCPACFLKLNSIVRSALRWVFQQTASKVPMPLGDQHQISKLLDQFRLLMRYPNQNNRSSHNLVDCLPAEAVTILILISEIPELLRSGRLQFLVAHRPSSSPKSLLCFSLSFERIQAWATYLPRPYQPSIAMRTRRVTPN
jgi:hypothetical protein